MSTAADKKKLLYFLDRKVFDPVLEKTEDDYDTDSKKKKFEEVKKSIEEEKQRFHNEETAEDIKRHFQHNLKSEPAQKVYSNLKHLDLPRLPQFKEEFYELCEKLGGIEKNL